MTIQLLSEETINQIAAGEVIESPASIVKELIENALDAGASKITVEVMGGGLKTICIIDDGVGMSPVDAPLSFLRHATSKIRSSNDLLELSTKGFRGEALASIASISKMTLTTAQEGEVGLQLEVEKGKVVKERKIARTRGTTIEVRSVFYNVPARKKFQKTGAAISAEIFRLVTVLSLSHPEVQFELISNGRKSLKTQPSEKIYDRAEALLGREFIRGSYPLEFEEGRFRFSGLIGAPTNTRANKMQQFLYLNRRAVTCPEISEAIRNGYGTRLDEKRYPLFLLHFDIPHDLIDVNVHPQKLTVRLREEDLLKDKIIYAIEKALGQKEEKQQRAATHYSFSEIKMRESAPLIFEEERGQEQELGFEKPIAQGMGVMGQYLFIHEEQTIVLVDLHAAKARILFEKLVGEKGKGVAKQGLLLPLTIELTPVETAMILTHQEAIEKVGFSLRLANEKELAIEAIPPFIDEREVKNLLAQMGHELQEFIGKTDYIKDREKKLAQTACRFAKINKHYTKEEGVKLYEELNKCSHPLHCPKGSLTTVRIDHDKVGQLFTEDQKASRTPC